LNLFFLSRISPKKNLSYALSRLLEVDHSCRINFSIFGPIEDEAYWYSCQGLMDQLEQKGSVNCRYHGAVPNHFLADVLEEQHFLFLPTLNENYGHVIVESWLAGCPVIISDQTPWQNLDEKKIGWSLDLMQPQHFRKVLLDACSMDEHTYAEWSANAQQWGSRVASSEEVLARTRELFR
jgi:glycosyltransferase involved in cell wall biosynthesis